MEAKQDGRRRGEPERVAGQRAGEVARPGAALERARERGTAGGEGTAAPDEIRAERASDAERAERGNW